MSGKADIAVQRSSPDHVEQSPNVYCLPQSFHLKG